MADRPPAVSRTSIPKLNKDPIWSLRLWSVEITVADHVFEVPALPATDWLVGILGMEEDTMGLVLNMLPEEDSEALVDLMLEGFLEPEELLDLALDLLSAVAARPWWVVMRLVALAQQNWDTVGAELTLRGVNPDTVSLAAWLDVLMLVTFRLMDPKEHSMFIMKLEMVPAEFVKQVPEKDLEISRESFLSMAG